MVLQLVCQVVSVLWLAVHHFAEHRRQNFGKHTKNIRFKENYGREPGAHRRAINHSKAFLGLQLEEAVLDARNLKCLGGINLSAIRSHGHGIRAAGDKSRDVGERDEIARSGDGAPERQARCHVGIEQRGDGLEDLEADAGVALEQGVDADKHRRARGGSGQHMAVAAGAERTGVKEPDELPLQSAALLGPPMGGGAEAGGDAVAVGAVGHAGHDPVAALLDAAAGGLVELHPGPVGGGHRRDLGDGQACALHNHHRPAVLLHHPLHGVQMAPRQRLRGFPPVERVSTPRLGHAQTVVAVGRHWFDQQWILKSRWSRFVGEKSSSRD
uniref:Secreted protein n=1 Tax=Triticum urartu TaxID=4572 RepID=A0A8R7PCK6_TRIUA